MQWLPAVPAQLQSAPAATGNGSAANLLAARTLHASGAAGAPNGAEAKPSLGGMPASDLKSTGSGAPGSAGDRDAEMQQPKSATFREGVVDAMRATQGAATDESPEADHPAYKYQHAEVSGDTRADDTGVSGMPADRPTATPAEGLGNQPDANAPEPKGEQGGLDSVPDELGANPHPHNNDATRQRWGDEEKEPLIRKTGAPEFDATLEPGRTPDKGSHGSTELYDEANRQQLAEEQAPQRSEESERLGP
jgi:hypothetical protein